MTPDAADQAASNMSKTEIGPQTRNQGNRLHPATAHAGPEASVSRIGQHPVLRFPEQPAVEFFFEGQRLDGSEGEPIAAALAANGIRIFRYTEKMHRARGFFCAVGKCSSCLMEVDGRPNVMVCMEPLKAGMKVRRQEGRGKIKADPLQPADIELQSAEPAASD